MRVLVTGGAGFIGSHVATRFSEEGHEVVILDNLSTGFERNVPQGVQFIEGDIGNKQLVTDLFKKHQFQIINHHAAQMNVRHSVADPSFDAKVNILGTLNLIQVGLENGLEKVMFASTGGAIYGEQNEFPATEEHDTNPISPYGVSKLATEKYLFYFAAQKGLKSFVMRYANVYGPRQNPFGEAGVVAIFSKLLSEGKQVTINGDGRQTRDYVYIDDLVEANLLGLIYDGSLTINIGTGIETDVVEIYKHLSKAAGVDIEPIHVPGKPGEQARSVITPARAGKILGWAPKMTITDGLATTYNSFK